MMWTAQYWRDLGERAIKTGAQTFAALLVAGQTILTIDWSQTAAVVCTAMIASVVTSIVSTGVGDHQTAAALVARPGRHRKGQ